MNFEWGPNKTATNQAKHKVSFHEAAIVFDDPLSVTVADPDHSLDEDRYIIVGTSSRGKRLIISFAERGEKIRIINARKLTPKKGKRMKKEIFSEMEDELRPEYDLKQLLKGGVRGKYVKDQIKEPYLVLLAPDVAQAFPSEEAVNEALRLVMQMAQIPLNPQVVSEND